jgi:hypothetical protein
MASKGKTTKKAAAPAHAPSAEHREQRNNKRAQQTVDRFRTSSKGFRGVFNGHFPDKTMEVETLAFHLAQFESGAGNRNPKRMALGLCENLSVLKTHLSRSIGALETLANGEAKKKLARK